VIKQREALIAKANTGDFKGLRAVTPAKSYTAKTIQNSSKDFVYGVWYFRAKFVLSADVTM